MIQLVSFIELHRDTIERLKNRGYEIIPLPKTIKESYEESITSIDRFSCTRRLVNVLLEYKAGILLPDEFDTEIMFYLMVLIGAKKPRVPVYIFKEDKEEIVELKIPGRPRIKPEEEAVYYVIIDKKENNLYLINTAQSLDIFGRLTFLGEVKDKELNEKGIKYFFAKPKPGTGRKEFLKGIQPLWDFISDLIPGKIKYQLFAPGSDFHLANIIRVKDRIDVEDLKKTYNANKVYNIDRMKANKIFKENGGATFRWTRKVKKDRLLDEYKTYLAKTLGISLSEADKLLKLDIEPLEPVKFRKEILYKIRDEIH